MTVFGALAHFMQRRVEPAFSPLRHRRHHGTLRRGAATPADRQRARASWWGDEPRWYPAGTPPRRHNRITPLIDGHPYLTELSAALARAESYVYVAGWCLTPELPLRRGSREEVLDTRLLSVLRDTAVRVPVRLLLWSGARAVIHPTQAEMTAIAARIDRPTGEGLVCRLDRSAHFSHCHHQKAIVIDGQVAFVGGMDLTTYQGDRWDLPGHPLRSGPNWHDVQLKLEGEVVADVEANFRQRWEGSAKHCQPPADNAPLPHREPVCDPGWNTPAQVIRTIAHHVYDDLPRGEFGIYHAYTTALKRARRFIYIENQYIWSPQIMDILIDQIQRPHDGPFRIVIVLPAGAHSGKGDNDRHVKRLRAADAGRGIVSIYALYASGPSSGSHAFRYRPVYVHAKVAVIDDEWLTVGSANLNTRGLVTDSEINTVVIDRALARQVRIDLWAEHLSLPREQIEHTDPLSLIDQAWRGRAAENAGIQHHLDRGERPLVCGVHTYETGRMPASWLLDEAESLTFEH